VCDSAVRLQAQVGEHAHKFRKVQFWITEGRLDRQDFHDEIHTGRFPLDDLDAKILAILDKSLFEFEFESARSIAKTLRIIHSIVLLHLHNSLGFRSFDLYWVRHLLTHDLREKQKTYAKAILPFLHAAERDGWHHLVTNNKSCFF
jgi:hypothetical protein